MPGTSKTHSFFLRAQCACCSTPSMIIQAVYNSTLALTSCLHRTSISFQGDSLGPPLVFPGYAHSCEHEHDILDSQDYVTAFQIHLWTPHSQLFLLTFLANLLFSPAGIPLLLSIMFDNCWWFFMTNAHGEKVACSWILWVRSGKEMFCTWDFPGNFRADQIMTVFWKTGLGVALNSFCPLQTWLHF